jgi:uncharacterized membrane protein YagU involved in acid resistance
MDVIKAIPIKTILLSGLLVGTLDIIAACASFYIATAKNPVGVLNYVASGIMGKDAFAGGTGIALLGLLCHYIIAFSFTFFFFWLYGKTSLLSKNRIVTAVVYGLFMWLVTTLIVVPLSNVPHNPLSAIKFSKALKAIGILVFMIGLPLSFIAYNTKKKRNKKPFLFNETAIIFLLLFIGW